MNTYSLLPCCSCKYTLTASLRRALPEILTQEQGKNNILSAITPHIQDNKVIGPSPCGFMKGRSCLTNPVSCGEITHSVHKRYAMGVVYLDLEKHLLVTHSKFLQKLTAHGLDRHTLCRVKLAEQLGPKGCCKWT